ncbi:RNA-directed DNA polymerase [Candidatus Saccharibacteria bacterium]|nr:RNA-directed DNA polymerase [Candidatus Saccharibacteria bacterium]
MSKEPPFFNIKIAIKEIRKNGIRQWLIEEMTESFIEARKGKLTTYNEHKFEIHWIENITKLVDSILDRTYKPGASTTFIVHDPKDREIFAAPFSDRNVHHLLYRISVAWWDKIFIKNSYSCRPEKGTYYGILQAWSMARSATNNFSEKAYIMKMDISNYFMSLPRKELYKTIRRGLYRQFKEYLSIPEGYELFKICDFLWYQIIMDDPVEHCVRRGDKREWTNLAPGKSLLDQPPDTGIAIGNVTSQLASNAYLDSFDKYVHCQLGYKYYGRYVDDFFIIVKESDLKFALDDVKRIREYLKKEKKLTLHPKKFSVCRVDQGFAFLGARIYPHCIIPADRLQKKIKLTLHQLRNEEISNERIISFLGMTKNLNATTLMRRLFKNYDLDFRLYQEFRLLNNDDKKKTRNANDIVADLRKSHWNDTKKDAEELAKEKKEKEQMNDSKNTETDKNQNPEEEKKKNR